MANPCDTIAYALSQSSAGDEILVDDSPNPYIESVMLGGSRSLRASNFAGADSGETIVDGGAGTAITVPATGATLIQGLTIRGNTVGVQLNGSAEVAGNVLDDPDANSGTAIVAGAGASGSQIHGNAIYDPAPATNRARSGIYAAFTAVDVVNNTFSGLNLGIQLDFAGPSLIEGNEITGTHSLPFAGQGMLLAGDVTARENEVSDSDGAVTGISTSGGATLQRNEITGQSNGVFVSANATGVSLEGDRIWGNSNFGIQIVDFDVNPPQTSVSATNVTVIATGIYNDGGALTLDSSIVDGIGIGGNAGTTCSITYSAGDTIGSDPTGCHDFDFDATTDPMLADPDNGDLHLLEGSAMIDAGDPATPGVGAVDFDGDARALDGTPECEGNVARRDIGADEYAPEPPDCEPPDTTITERPGRKTKKKKVTFGFESTESSSTFTCKLDEKPEEECTSPLEMKVNLGKHRFRVFATDEADNADESPAVAKFKRKRRH